MTTLIDIDSILYRAAIRYQEESGFVDVEEVCLDLNSAVKYVDSKVSEIQEATKVESIRIAISCPSKACFRRKLVDPTYKSNREGIVKPVLLGALQQHCRENYEVIERDSLEADDICGILGTKYPGEYILSSIDKDFNTIPGRWFNPDKPEEGVVKIGLTTANLWFFTQTLTGDTTDGYPGCPGIGEKKAAKFFSEMAYPLIPHEDLWEGIVELFEKKGLTEDDAIKQARLARILRAEDYNSKTKEVILWQPPKRYDTKES